MAVVLVVAALAPLAVNALYNVNVGWFASIAISGDQLAFLGVGFCGALTTYSSFAAQVVALGPRRGAAYAVSTLALCLAACAVGYVL